MANSAAQPRNIDFDGVVSAVITTFDQAGQLNEAAFRRVLEYQIEGGVHGFWVAGGTGEGVMLTADENARLMQAAVEQTAGRAKVIGHVGAITTTVAAQQSAAAARAGVDAICAVPAFFGRHDSDELAEHYRVIADAAGDLPFFAYNIPHTTGVDLTPALLRKIRERVPQLVGLKHSAPNTGHIHAFARDGLACLIGHSGMMVPALDMGGAGVVDSTPGVLP
jgi:dihydrodipicolinate synthase/N-acetylneuraminate lyase